jgi:hypothetical protein
MVILKEWCFNQLQTHSLSSSGSGWLLIFTVIAGLFIFTVILGLLVFKTTVEVGEKGGTRTSYNTTEVCRPY